jgi:hypothetical protein
MVLRQQGFTIVMETMAVAAVAESRFALHKDDDITTDDALCSGNPIWHVPAVVTKNSSSMSLGTSLL